MDTQTQQFRRRTNGTIDIDYYRSRAAMERRAAMTNMARRMDISALRLLVAAALIVVLMALPSHDPASKDTAANATPAAIAVALDNR